MLWREVGAGAVAGAEVSPLDILRVSMVSEGIRIGRCVRAYAYLQ